MRHPKSYDGIDFAAVQAGLSDVPGFADMHHVRKRKLALLLIESRCAYDLFRQRETTVSPKTSAAQIKNLLGSISLIANFARDAETKPAAKDAMNRLFWTADALSDSEARDAMNAFFSAAVAVHKIAKQAERAMASYSREKHGQSAIVWLCGRRLPAIYSKIFDAKFTTTRGGNPGIEFVQSALATIGVRNSISDETILSHFKAARRVSAL